MSELRQRQRRYREDRPHTLSQKVIDEMRKRHGDLSNWPATEAQLLRREHSKRFADTIANGLNQRGYPPADIAAWTQPLLPTDQITMRDATLVVRHALQFHLHNVPTSEAIDWWMKFTSSTISLQYRHAGHTPQSAAEVWETVRSGWMWTMPPRPETVPFETDVARRAHRWTLTGLDRAPLALTL